MLGSLFKSRKSSSSATNTTNNDNRQVNDAGGGSVITGGLDVSRPLSINGTGNQIHVVDGAAALASMFSGMGQAQGAAGLVNTSTTGHEVTKAGQAQAGAWAPMTDGSGKWLIVAAVVAVVAVVAKVAR